MIDYLAPEGAFNSAGLVGDIEYGRYHLGSLAHLHSYGPWPVGYDRAGQCYWRCHLERHEEARQHLMNVCSCHWKVDGTGLQKWVTECHHFVSEARRGCPGCDAVKIAGRK